MAAVLRYLRPPIRQSIEGMDVLKATDAGAFALTTSPANYVSRPRTQSAPSSYSNSGF